MSRGGRESVVVTESVVDMNPLCTWRHRQTSQAAVTHEQFKIAIHKLLWEKPLVSVTLSFPMPSELE